MNKVYFSLLVFLILGTSTVQAQAIDKEHSSYPYAKASLSTLKGLLAIPNDANFPEDIQRNIDWCKGQFEVFNFTSEELPTETVPLLLAEAPIVDESLPTVLYYFHIDGQPVDPQFWYQEDPYQAVLKKEVEAEGWVDLDWQMLSEETLDPEWRIFARSSSDDKAPFVMFLTALKQLQTEELSLPYNLKVILDFEEEKGSPRLASCVEENKVKLEADYLLIFDGPKHPSNRTTIAFGARGITTITLKVYGPTFPLHSGHYGNYAPNPALRLSQLLASMKDNYGRVIIPGYYDGIGIDAKTKSILASVPDDENKLKIKLGIGEIDHVGKNYQESMQYPSLNIRGLASGWVGSEARTIVPATATAEIDLRLVVETPPKRQVDLVRNFIEIQGYHIVDKKPTSQERFLNPKIIQFTNDRAYKAFRTELDSPIGNWTYSILKKEFGEEPIRIRTIGGSLPVTPFIQTLNVPALIIPLVNSDNNQHSPNENLRLGNYFDGVITFHALLRNGL